MQGLKWVNESGGLVANRKKDEKKVEQKTKELMDNVMKVEWVKKHKKLETL